MDLTLTVVAGRFAVHRFAPEASIPDDVWESPFVSISRTPDELSIVTAADIPVDAQRSVGPWKAFRVAGAMDFTLTGVMAALTAPLAAAAIGILAIGTFDTDFVLVPPDRVDDAVTAWRAAGIRVDA